MFNFEVRKLDLSIIYEYDNKTTNLGRIHPIHSVVIKYYPDDSKKEQT